MLFLGCLFRKTDETTKIHHTHTYSVGVVAATCSTVPIVWHKPFGCSLSDSQRVVVAPDYAESVARRVMFMLDTLTSTIGYGLLPKGVGPLAMPVVVHAESSSSNGITIMAPRRIDINSMPSTEEIF